MSDTAVRRRGDRAMFAVVFLMLFVFSYSEQFVSGVTPHVEGADVGWRTTVIVIDAVVLGAIGLLKRVVAKADGTAPRLWGWWWTGVGLLLAIDAIRLWLLHSVAVDLLSGTAYALAVGWTTAAALNADPMTLFRTERRVASPVDWVRVRAIVPLAVGAWLCYLASTAYIDVLDTRSLRTVDASTAEEIASLGATEKMGVLAQLCHGAINPVFFHQVVGMLPVLLLTLGVEFNYFRRILIDAGPRAATAATATVLAAGLVGALSTLPWDGRGCGDVLSGWHEYVAFLLAVQAVFTGLATLVWLLVSSTPDTVEASHD